MLQNPNYIDLVSKTLNLKPFQVSVVFELTLEGSTVPFIARYRKERTGNLDESQIRDIIELQKKEENLFNAKNTAINGITELGMMTEELMQNIINAKTLKEVEEIYKPYKSKKKTKAMLAIEKGFQVVADNIKKNKLEIPDNLLKSYSKEEIIEGSIDIIGAEISANSDLRHYLIEELYNYGNISSSKKSEKMLEKLNEKDKGQISKFEIYFDFDIKISNIKPYQILALNRGENLGILNVKIEKNEEIFNNVNGKYSNILGLRNQFIDELLEAFKIGYEAIFSSVENEIRSDLNEKGEDDSIKTFQTNLQALLMTKPEYGKIILAIDPGFRAGCKLAVLDKIGNPIYFDKIFLHSLVEANKKLKEIIKKYEIEDVIVGNGTGTDDVQKLLTEVFTGEVFIVNESGASVYSASDIAQDEFPNLDSLDRGTISIGRRYIDPLSELVKVPVGSIGVGMYQHDMPEKKLEEKLGYVVEDSVNQVGINVNLASIYLLNHISGIDKRQAKKIYASRPYKSRAELKKVLSEKAYEQAIGFLRVPESKEELDNTDIHPDQYKLAKYIIENKKNTIDEKMKELYPDVNTETIKFIIDSYNNLGKEKRVNSTHMKSKKAISLESLSTGEILDGVVRNVVAFGAFIDVGLKNDGLVHISELSDSFVKNPMDIVKVGDKVKVRVTAIDIEKGKIQLSMRNI
nr:Tex-like N-terminal domain-containing protein [Candidatus Gracilibacteria bacterium]